MPEKMWHLKNCDLFQRLAPEELKHLEVSCRVRTFPRGGLIYAPRDLGEGVLLLAAGRVKLCTITAEGKQPILAFIEPGELFGELAILETGNRDEYAEAWEPSTVIFIPADSLRQLMERHAHLSIGITRLMGLRRRRVERRLKSLLFRSNRERLVALLLELSEQYGSPTANGVEIGIKLSHQDLANIIGATRESVTISLGELQSEGMVEMGRRRIVVKDLARLAQGIHAQPPKLAAARCPSDQACPPKADAPVRANEPGM
jgi:CRP-like cAMP-binding protein